MNLETLGRSDFVGSVVGFLLTVTVFSYLFKDNVIFRLVIHIFIGTAAGMAAAVVLYQVIWTRLIQPFWSFQGGYLDLLVILIPIILSVLLLLKTSRRTTSWGSPVMAFLVGVGAATAIGGAVLGTVLPQVSASINSFEVQNVEMGMPNLWFGYLNGFFLLIATIGTLIYFQFGWWKGERNEEADVTWISGLTWIGKVTISVTLGVLFAGILIAAISALVDRIDYLLSFIISLVKLKP